MENGLKVKLENLKRINETIDKALDIYNHHSKIITKDDLISALQSDLTINVNGARDLDYSNVLYTFIEMLRNKWTEINMIDNPYPYVSIEWQLLPIEELIEKINESWSYKKDGRICYHNYIEYDYEPGATYGAVWRREEGNHGKHDICDTRVNTSSERQPLKDLVLECYNEYGARAKRMRDFWD